MHSLLSCTWLWGCPLRNSWHQQYPHGAVSCTGFYYHLLFALPQMFFAEARDVNSRAGMLFMVSSGPNTNCTHGDRAVSTEDPSMDGKRRHRTESGPVGIYQMCAY